MMTIQLEELRSGSVDNFTTEPEYHTEKLKQSEIQSCFEDSAKCRLMLSEAVKLIS